MKVLFLPNWRVFSERGKRQAADYHVPGEPYWFFRHFREDFEVEVLDAARWPGFRMEEQLLHFYAGQAVAALRRLKRFDVVLAHGAQSAVLLLAFARGLQKTIPPVVVVDAGALNQGRPERRVSFALTRWALGGAAHIVWHSRASEAMVLRYAPELSLRGEFMHFGTDADRWSPQPDDGGYAVCIGRRYRDYQLLAEAWSLLKDIPIVVLGVSEKRISGLKGVFPGNVPFDEYQRYVQQARVVVLPLPEGAASFGQMTLMDAFAAAKPVVVSDVGPVRDYLGPWCTAVPGRDPAAFARAVRCLWEDDAARDKMGKEARQAAERLFSERAMAWRLEKILKDCVDGAASGESPGLFEHVGTRGIRSSGDTPPTQPPATEQAPASPRAGCLRDGADEGTIRLAAGHANPAPYLMGAVGL